MAQKLYYNDITILKVLATFLITWFHFKWNVPDAYGRLFIGGAIGNSLFFYASGYLMKFREEQYRGQWLVNRIIRLYPNVWVFLLLTLFLGNNESLVFQNYLFPTPFWFVNSILISYIISYVLRKFLYVDVINRVGYFILGLLVSAYVIYYILYIDHSEIILDEGKVKYWYFSFFFLFWGYRDHVNNRLYNGTLKTALLFPLAIVLFYGYKIIGAHCTIAIYLQFLFVPLFLSLIIVSGRYFANYLSKIKLSDFSKRILSYLSNLTLDIYIVQMFLIYRLMPEISFPLNVFSLLIIILIIAMINNFIAGHLSTMLTNTIRRLYEFKR